MTRSVVRGLVYGCSLWIVYGVVELLLTAGFQLFHYAETRVMIWQWPLIAMLFVAYVLAGAISGAAAGILLRWARWDGKPGAHGIAAALTLTAAFVANLISAKQFGGYEALDITVASVLALTAAAGYFSKRALRHSPISAGPFTVCVLLLGPVWIGKELSISRWSRLTLALILILAVAATAAVRAKWLRTQPSALRPFVAAFILFVIFGASAFYKDWTGSVHIPGALSNQRAGKPNVLLITMDTVRADHLSVYGYERDTTPNLREFARESTVYNRAIATSDYTLSTHASIFTGLYPDWHGAMHPPGAPSLPIFRQSNPLLPAFNTLAAILSSQGYWTAESVANYGYLGASAGLTRGFMEVDWTRPVTLAPASRELYRANGGPPLYLRGIATRLIIRALDIVRFGRPVKSASDVNRNAKTMLEAARANGRPFLLFLNYMDAHWPYVSDPPYNSRYPGRIRGFLPPFWGGAVNQGTGTLPKRELEHFISQYDGGIASEDAAIGEIFRWLRDSGVYENTLIVITADHGEGLLEHGILDHDDGVTYQTHVHIPLLIKYPHRDRGEQANFLVSQVDLLPTILESADIAVPQEVQGASLLQRRSREDAVFVVSRMPRHSENPLLRGTRQAVLMGTKKLVRWTDGPPELYDLDVDPGEQRNLYQPEDSSAKTMEDRLTKWVASAPKLAPSPAKLDKGTVERLKSLGYVQ